jgi:hypothetical protein
MDWFSPVFFLGFLFLPALWLGFKFYIDFFAYDRGTLTVGRIVPLACFVRYRVFVLNHGVEGAMRVLGGTGLRRGRWTFILPGIGFALAAFPYQAAELMSDARRRIALDLRITWRGQGGAYCSWWGCGTLYC